MFICFELNEFSRHMVLAGQAMFPLDRQRMHDAGDVFIANANDPLAFIAFGNSLIRQMVWQAGMAVTKVSYGCWMGGGIGDGLQDAIVCTKLPALKTGDDVQMTPLVRREPNGRPDKPASSFKKLLRHWTGR